MQHKLGNAKNLIENYIGQKMLILVQGRHKKCWNMQGKMEQQ